MDPLIRKKLPEGWIDLCIGEARTTRRALAEVIGSTRSRRVFDDDLITAEELDCDYQAPTGYEPLVEVLKQRHGQFGAQVIVTAGAKQGLAAVFYALKKLGTHAISMRTPFWSQMPQAIKLSGLGLVLGNRPTWGTGYLIVSPNNPDGYLTRQLESLDLIDQCERLGTKLVHDAAYYTPTYLDGCLPPLAPTSIYSASKAYGLSGLRVGHIVTYDPDIAHYVQEYVEAATVGVSLPAQKLMHRIIEHELTNPAVSEEFHRKARSYLDKNKQIISQVHPDVLDTSSATTTAGMFGWFPVGPKFNAEKAMLVVPPGEAFGDGTRVRLNLAVDSKEMLLAVERLNALV